MADELREVTVNGVRYFHAGDVERWHRDYVTLVERVDVVEQERDEAREALHEFNSEAVLSLMQPGRLREWRIRFAALAEEQA